MTTDDIQRPDEPADTEELRRRLDLLKEGFDTDDPEAVGKAFDAQTRKWLAAERELHARNRVVEALIGLAVRLWCDDKPEDPSTLASIDEWVANLPEDEAAALNAILGESFGKGPAWDSDHPISMVVRDDDS